MTFKFHQIFRPIPSLDFIPTIPVVSLASFLSYSSLFSCRDNSLTSFVIEYHQHNFHRLGLDDYNKIYHVIYQALSEEFTPLYP